MTTKYTKKLKKLRKKDLIHGNVLAIAKESKILMKAMVKYYKNPSEKRLEELNNSLAFIQGDLTILKNHVTEQRKVLKTVKKPKTA